MSLLDLLDKNSGYYPAPYVPQDAFDIAEAGIPATSLPASLSSIWDKKGFKERNDLIGERFGVDYAEFSGVKPNLWQKFYTGRGDEEKINEEIDKKIISGRKNFDKRYDGIKTKQEIIDEVTELGKQTEEEYGERIAKADSDISRYGGIGISALSTVVTDPVNLATLPFGAAASMNVLKAIRTEALINAAIEAAEVPLYKDWANRVGREYGLREAAIDIATAGVAAGALTGVVRGAAYAGKHSFEYLQKLSDSPNIPSSVRDALKFQERVAHIDSGTPFKTQQPLNKDFIQHLSLLEETQNAVKQNRAVSFPEEIIAKIDNMVFERDLQLENAARAIDPTPFNNFDKLSKDVDWILKEIDQINRTEIVPTMADVVQRIDPESAAKIRKYEEELNTDLKKDRREHIERQLQREIKKFNLDDLASKTEQISKERSVRLETLKKKLEIKRSELKKSKDDVASSIDKTANIRVDKKTKTFDGRDSSRITRDVASPRPFNVEETMRRAIQDIEKIESSGVYDSKIKEMMRIDPNRIIETEDGKRKLSDVLSEIEEDEIEIQAIRTCSIK